MRFIGILVCIGLLSTTVLAREQVCIPQEKGIVGEIGRIVGGAIVGEIVGEIHDRLRNPPSPTPEPRPRPEPPARHDGADPSPIACPAPGNN